MACSVQIVHTFSPKRESSRGVELRASGTIGELKHGKINKTLQHQCVGGALFGRCIAQSDGSCDVGCAVLILSATINKHQSVWLYGDVCFGCGFVVHDGAVCFIANDGLKRFTFEQWLFGSKRC